MKIQHPKGLCWAIGLPLLLVCTFLVIIGCGKEDGPSPNNPGDPNNGFPDCNNAYRLSKHGNSEFFYNDQGKLAKRIEKEANGEDFIYYYDYTLDEKPDKISIMRLINGLEVQIREETITYSAARHPVSLVDFNLNDSTVLYHYFTTDNQGRITVDSMRNAYYDIGENTVTWDGENLSGFTLVGLSKTTYKFDNNLNPFYDIRHCFLDTPTSTFYWSKNNAVSGTYKASIVEEDLDLKVSYYDGEHIWLNTSGEYHYECK